MEKNCYVNSLINWKENVCNKKKVEKCKTENLI